jgi:hypothetical protein
VDDFNFDELLERAEDIFEYAKAHPRFTGSVIGKLWDELQKKRDKR